MNKPRLEDKNGIASVIDKEGNVVKTFSTKDHGKSYLSAAQLYLQQNYDKLMAEEVEQMDEALVATPRKHILKLEKQDPDNSLLFLDYKTGKSPKAYKVKRYNVHHRDTDEKVGVIDHIQNYHGPSFKGKIYGKSIPEDSNSPDAQKLLNHLERTGFAKKTSEMKEEVEQMDEAHKINDPVEIVKGPGKGTKGYIGEIRHGLYKGAPKRYTVFHGKDGATQVDKEHIRKIKGEVKQMDEENDYIRRRTTWEDEIAGKKPPAKRKPRPQTDYEKMRAERKKQGLDEAGVSVKSESVELEESEKGHSIVKELKVKGKHEEAGRMAFKHGLSRSYGPHFGMRSTKDKDERDFHRGYDMANMESIKKRAGADRAFVAESNSDSAVEGYKDAIIHRLHKSKHPETGENLMLHLLKKHPFDKVRDAVYSSAEFHGEGAEEIGGSDVTAATHTALHYLGEKELVDKLRANARKPLEEKLTKDMSAGKIISDFVHSDDKRFKGKSNEERKRMALGAYYSKHENKIYTNIISKLEEGRHAKPTPEHIVAQILKHQDYGYKDHEYTFHDGSKLNVTPEKRDKIIRKIQSLTGPGPGKNPEARKKLYDELNTRKGFLHHTGDEPIPVKKLHPMSAQKK